MINRRATVYYKLPDELTSGKWKDAKMEISVNMTLPKGFESKGTDIIDEIIDDAKDQFKKFMKKQIKKQLERNSD